MGQTAAMLQEAAAGAQARQRPSGRPKSLLESGGKLGVRLLECPGGRIEILAHASEALDHLGSARAELGVSRLELLAGRIRDVPAGDQVVDQALKPAEIARDLLLARP